MGTICTTNRTIWTTTLGTAGSVIENEVFVELQNAINRENVRRGLAADTFTPTADGGTISAINVKQIYDNIAKFKSMSWSSSYNALTGVLITPAQLVELRINLNDAEDDCTCDCNYCTCNCNYCTCNCNYCTCDCNYACTCVCAYACTCNCNYACTCVCNYSCTCNCNYSDERLKTNIVYF